MARQSEHEAKARSNEDLIEPLERLDSHPDWVATVKFYAAVHWLRALLAKHGTGTGSKDVIHYNGFSSAVTASMQKAEGRIANDVDEALEAFEDLRDISQAARYQCLTRSYFDQQMYEADKHLARVRSFVESRGVRVSG